MFAWLLLDVGIRHVAREVKLGLTPHFRLGCGGRGGKRV